MPTTNYYAGNLQWLGLAKETTPGTAQSAPSVWIPVNNPVFTPKISVFVDQALRGMMGTDFQQVQGMKYGELTYDTYLYEDSAFLHLAAMLGLPDAVSGTAPTVTHKTALNNVNNVATYTGFLGQPDGQARIIPGMVMVEAKVAIKADSLASLTITWNGMPSTFGTASNTPGTVPPMPVWPSTVTLGGTLRSNVSDIEFDIKRGTKPIPVLNGSQSPLAIYPGELNVAITGEIVYQGSTDVDLANFLANTQPTLTVTAHDTVNASHVLTLQASVMSYDQVSAAGGSSGWMTGSITGKALMNPTDALDSKMSPMQVSFINATSTPIG